MAEHEPRAADDRRWVALPPHGRPLDDVAGLARYLCGGPSPCADCVIATGRALRWLANHDAADFAAQLDAAFRAGVEQGRREERAARLKRAYEDATRPRPPWVDQMRADAEALTDRDGICGDQPSPAAAEHLGTCGPPPVCTLRFGHRSEWHENDTGTRWRHARVDRDRTVAATALREYADRHHHFGQAGSGPIDDFDIEHWAECSCGAEWSTETEHGFEGCTERDCLLADAAALEVGEPAADADGKSSGERAGAERSEGDGNDGPR
jgi:hypothetical protein